MWQMLLRVAMGTAKQDDANENECLACTDQSSGGVTGCANCTCDSTSARIQCTRCTTNHLKKKADGSTECVADAQCDISGNTQYKVGGSQAERNASYALMQLARHGKA